MGTKEAKAAGGEAVDVIFKIYSGGVKTNRDAWAYNFNRNALTENMSGMIDTYNEQVFKWERQVNRDVNLDDFVVYDDRQISWSGDLRTCFKKQGMIPRCCGFVNPQRATSQGRGWVSQPIGLGNQAPTIDLTRFAEYGDNMPLNSGRPSGLRKKPSFEEKTRFQGK